MSKETEKAFMRFMGRESMKSIHQEREVKIAERKEKELPNCGICGKPIKGRPVIDESNERSFHLRCFMEKGGEL